ncbi:BCCT transporter [Sporosarcina sp. P13]|uniref:BCCT family transporter n=1 Tax=Sporosarcina sp. P13 TaxID=2048263 RepID=UPI000C17153D|nr:BCCT family transporter [Sporosarcina sp. P13]PIC63237.1 BCCT transporter [Sporosarcina sp. P13]
MNESKSIRDQVNWSVLGVSGGFFVFFIIMSIMNDGLVGKIVNFGFDWSVRIFGAYWQVLLPATFIVGAIIAMSASGKAVLGKTDKPEMSYFKWAALVITGMLGAGAVFWAAAEPLSYFMNVPPVFSGIKSGTAEAVGPALAQSFMDWGFTATAMYGAIASLVLMYAHHNKGMPLKPRTLLYPVFGEKIKDSKLGSFVDAACIISACAGAIAPIGFLGLQTSQGLETILGWPNTFTMVIIVIGVLTAIVVLTIVTGIDKGIQWLSKLNVNLIIFVTAALLLLGPGEFIVNTFISSMGTYTSEFINIATFRGDSEWLSSWMLFYFPWFIGFGPLISIFVARVSRGRTIRQVFVLVAVISPLFVNFWFTVVGGTGIFFEMQNPGVISSALETGGAPAAAIAVAQQMPFGLLMSIVIILLTIICTITTTNSISYSASISVVGTGNPPVAIRLFWSLIMPASAVLLIWLGDGGIGALQSLVVITAVPISIIVLPLLWKSPGIAKQLAFEQGLVKNDKPVIGENNVEATEMN